MAWQGLFTGAIGACTIACSAGMQTLPRNWAADQKPVCSESSAAPAMDVTAGVVLGLIAFMGAALESSLSCGFVSGQEECDDGSGGRAFLVGTLVATPFIASAIYGISKGNECERAKLQHHAYITRDRSTKCKASLRF